MTVNITKKHSILQVADMAMAGALCMVVLLVPSVLAAQQNWKFRLEKNGIKVYTAEQPGSKFLWVKSTFEADATLSQFASVVWNIDKYKLWNFAQGNPYVIKQTAPNALQYYTEAKSPWPLQDRFMVLNLQINQDPASGVVNVSLENVPEMMPQKEGLTRMKAYTSMLTLVPIAAKRLKVECVVYGDPGGHIPAWAVNLVVDQMPVRAFTSLKEYLKTTSAETDQVPFVRNK